MRKSVIIEACVETIEEAMAAEACGADRIEFCSDLNLDGLTPKIEQVEALLSKLHIPIKVMIRPRGGDFSYNKIEQEEILSTILKMKEIGVKDYVYGSISEGRLDLTDLTTVFKHLTSANFRPNSFTIHKAIDTSDELLEDVSILLGSPLLAKATSIDCQIAILSSGGKSTAKEGYQTLKEMIRLAGNKLEIVAAGKITDENLSSIDKLIAAKAYHGRKIISY